MDLLLQHLPEGLGHIRINGSKRIIHLSSDPDRRFRDWPMAVTTSLPTIAAEVLLLPAFLSRLLDAAVMAFAKATKSAELPRTALLIALPAASLVLT